MLDDMLEYVGLKETKKKKGKYKKLPKGTKFAGGRRYEQMPKKTKGFFETVVDQFTDRADLYSGKKYSKGGMVTDYRKTGMTKSTVNNLKAKKKK